MMAMHELHRCTPAGYDPECTDALARIVHLPDLEDILPSAGPVRVGEFLPSAAAAG